jgi:hypothetical protein
LICYGVVLKAIIIGVVVGFVTSFIAMNGFDSLKDIWKRFQVNEEADSDEGGEG